MNSITKVFSHSVNNEITILTNKISLYKRNCTNDSFFLLKGTDGLFTIIHPSVSFLFYQFIIGMAI